MKQKRRPPIMLISKGEVTSLSSGGEGLLRQDGKVIFIPFTAPGDVVTYEIAVQRKNFCHGKLLQIINPSPHRVSARCQYFGSCGGCQLQHINYQQQLHYKQQNIIDALTRIGGLNFSNLEPIEPAEEQWAYRRHIKLKLIPQKQGYQAVYTTYESSFIAIDSCPIFIHSNDSFMASFQEFLKKFICTPFEAKATILKTPTDQFILMFDFKQVPPNAENVAKSIMKLCDRVTGIQINGPGIIKSVGDLSCKIDIEGISINCSPKSFIQNHPQQSLKIYKKLIQIIKSDKILDLYCGIGISSLLLAKNNKNVLGIELNRDAVTLAKKNAKYNQLNAAFICSDVKKNLKSILKEFKPGSVILNPPREGVEKEILATLLTELPKEIIYISCMPSTLARDLSYLCANAYAIESCQAFDMFPQTGHVETFVHLKPQQAH